MSAEVGYNLLVGSFPSLKSVFIAYAFPNIAYFHLVPFSTSTNAVDVWHIFASLTFIDMLFSPH